MKVSDYVSEYLVKEGVKHTFGITGGAIIHILDSIYANKALKHICNHNEQASAMAADAYSRITENIGVGISTSGPGATNLLTGVCCAYYDSIPSVFLTGQVPTSQLKRGQKVRQVGFQETDVTEIFKPVTKYATLIDNPLNIRLELEKAFYFAREGRPGPVLLDICDDVQRANIDSEKLISYNPPLNQKPYQKNIEEKVSDTVRLLENSERPVIIFGGGIRLAKATKLAYEFLEKTEYPVATTWAAIDLIPNSHHLLVGGFGVSGNRAGNFTLQNADLILGIGTRMDTHEAGSNAKNFAREAKKIFVDIDPTELEKDSYKQMDVNLTIEADVTDFFKEINKIRINPNKVSEWKTRIKQWKYYYPICPNELYKEKGAINPYVFLDYLSEVSSEGDIIITDAGSNLTQTMQGFKIKKDQRLISAFNHSPMGYSLPASIGASFAANSPITCIIGDGGLQMNLQELATISHHNLPVKIFVFNNEGYSIIRQTQDIWLNGRYNSSSLEHLTFPDLKSISKAYGIEFKRIPNHNQLRIVKEVLHKKTPIVCEVNINPKSRIVPKLEYGKPIEDLSPLLPREEFKKNMIVKCLEN